MWQLKIAPMPLAGTTSMNPFILLMLLLQYNHVHVLGSSVFDLSQIRKARNNGPNVIPSLESDVSRLIGMAKPVANTVSTPVPEYEPLPAITPDTTSTIINNNNTKKRKMDHKPQPTALEAMTLQELLAFECKKVKFHKPERTAQLLKTLNIIAANDRQAYDRDEANFKEVMGCEYVQFRDNYFMRYWIMFGADQLFRFKLFHRWACDHGLEEAVRYLLATKPLDQVFKTLAQASGYEFDPAIRAKIHGLVLEKYPDLPHFQKIMIMLFGNTTVLFKLNLPFNQAHDPSKSFSVFKDLVAFICKDRPSIPSNEDIFARLPLKYPQYYKALPNDLKYGMVRAAIRVDNPDILTQVLILDPEMYKTQDDSILDRTILHDAIESHSPRCIRMILETLPELATLSVPDRIIPALEYIMHFKSKGFFLQIIPDFPFIRYDLVLDRQPVPLNLLQLALLKWDTDLFKYLVNQAGILEARKQIRAHWPTDPSLLLHIKTVCSYYVYHPLINYVIELMEIDLNATYRYKDLEGNAMIFLHDLYCRDKINNFNRDAPCYRIIDGIKTKISFA